MFSTIHAASFSLALGATIVATASPAIAATAIADASRPRLTIEGTAGDLTVGTMSDYRVMVYGAPPVAGVQLVIKYDPAKVRVIDADAKTTGAQALHGTFFIAGKEFFTVRNDADAKTGELNYVVSALYPAKESQGDGKLLTFRIAPSRPGDSVISIVSAKFGDFAGKPYEVTLGEPLTLHAVPGTGGFLGEAKALQQASMPAAQPALPKWMAIAAAIAFMILIGGTAFWFGRRARQAPA